MALVQEKACDYMCPTEVSIGSMSTRATGTFGEAPEAVGEDLGLLTTDIDISTEDKLGSKFERFLPEYQQ